MSRVMKGAAVLAAIAEGSGSPPNYSLMWQEFKQTYEKDYANEDENTRFAIFRKNVDLITETNAKKLSFTLGVNQFADLTQDEFKAQYLGWKQPEKTWGEAKHLGTQTYSGKTLPDSVDWVEKGAVTPVKNQGQCGSCWSFSTTGSLEGRAQLAIGNLVALSEQQFVDCDHVDHGCRGGLMDNGFNYAESNAICTEASYAYKARSGSCKQSSCEVGLYKGAVTGFQDVQSNDANAMMEALSAGPVSIAIEADQSAFTLYSGGVFTATCGARLDHGVLAVGYGTDGGQDYWKVKNSWGASWGEDGYIRLERGLGGAGQCGLLSKGSYPVISDGPAPPPGPAPPAPPAPPAGAHYEAPPCADDETALTLQGEGSFCAPSCDGGCPAPGKCAVRDQSGNQYCGLECGLLDSCPDGMSCSSMFSGICLWPESAGLNGREVFALKKEVVV